MIETTMVRPAAVAGTFYPGTAEALGGMVDQCLRGARISHAAPKAMIAPHAGFIYSGPIAGTIYASLAEVRQTIRRVVLLGPAHRVAFEGFALSGASHFETPLGRVPVDREAIETLLALPRVRVLEAAHAEEHSLEVHLPFLQRALEDFTLVPVLVGQAAPDEVDSLLEALWGGPETLIVISSDLSHYHDYEAARKLDLDASRAIEMLRPDQLRDEQACGRLPIKGLLARARALDLRATTLDLRNSGNTAGSKDRVVGYGAYSFEYARTARLAEKQRKALMDAARKTIRYASARGKPPKVGLGSFAPQLESARASFVTLTLEDKLRGCIGTLAAEQPLVADVVQNAYRAGFGDPRFKPLTKEEVERVEIGISILGTPRAIEFADEKGLAAALHPDQDGVILEDGDKRGLFLPQVWEQITGPAEFVSRLKVKAGLPANHWSPRIKAWRFSVESFGSD